MGDSTGISWTDATWNPIRGCSRVSEGCRHCYAETQAARIVRMGNGKPTAYDGLVRLARIPASSDSVNGATGEPGWIGDGRAFAFGVEARWTGEVRFVAEHLADPLRWRRPRRIFVNSMSDLFHERLPDEVIDQAYAVMLLAHWHTFQVLTKRAARMRRYFAAPDLYERILRAANKIREQRPELNQVGISNPATHPARWIWLGVSVENQAAADERIPELLATPAAVRFISAEPLLGEVDAKLTGCFHDGAGTPERPDELETHAECTPRIDWVIAGCESGPGARPCEAAWLRSLRDQCEEAGTAFFLKQATGWDEGRTVVVGMGIGFGDGSRRKSGGVIELPYLDGKQHAAFPAVTA